MSPSPDSKALSKPAAPDSASGGAGGASRQFATVLCAGMVDANGRATGFGDGAWQQRIGEHERLLRATVAGQGGEVLRSSGEGALCLFPEPGRAVACALALQAAATPLDLQLRIGLHLGEVERHPAGAPAGLAVQVAARVAAAARTGETLVTETVCRAMTGTAFGFVGRGRRRLRGVPGRWALSAAGPDQHWQARQLSVRRLRGLALAGALLTLAAVGGVALPGIGSAPLDSLAVAVQNRPAIAVLPFSNLSSREEDAYFAIGVQDEILTRLAKISALKVLSRTSSERFGNAPPSRREIGRQLGVSHVVEGSVQRRGDTVQVTVQLIDTRRDAPVWTEVYDRQLADLLGVQGEVARAVAKALDARLSDRDRERLRSPRPVAPAAYDAYLQGLAIKTRSGWGEANMRQAIQHFEQAVQADPEFVAAWAQLAATRSMLHVTYVRDPALGAAAESAARAALELDPDSLGARIAYASYVYLSALDIPEGRRLFEQIDRLDPGQPEVQAALAAIAQDQGRWDEALAYFEQGLSLDPQNRDLHWDYIFLLNGLHRFAEAHRALDRALRVFPDYMPLLVLRANAYMAEDRMDEADAVLNLPAEDSADRDRVWARLQWLDLHHDFAAALEILEPLLPEAEPGFERVSINLSIGRLYLTLGEPERARPPLEASRAEAAELVKVQNEGSYIELMLAHSCALLGDHAAARRHRDAPRAFFERNGLLSANMYQELAADIDVALGDHESAMDRLLRLRGQVTDLTMPLTAEVMRRDPRWGALHGHPKFAELVAPP